MNDLNRTQLLADPNKTQMGPAPSNTFDANKTMMGTGPSLNATQIIKPTQCPICKTFNPAGVMFCTDCGLIFDRALSEDAFGAPAIQLPTLVDSNGREHAVRPGDNIVGREGDVLIADSRASRRHSKLISLDGKLLLEDLGSTNGTKVDGVRLNEGEQRALTGGEKLSFGGFEMVLNLPGGGPASATQNFASNKTGVLIAPPSVQTAAAHLVGEGERKPLKDGINTFGRKSENDISIQDPYVSGKHGLIEITEEGAFLTDIGSTNGTMLNDAKLVPNMRTAIGPSDVIRLGSLEFTVVRGGEEA